MKNNLSIRLLSLLLALTMAVQFCPISALAAETELAEPENSVTEGPLTEDSAPEDPQTEAPAPEEPETEAPAPEEPETEPPATEEPETEAPATEEPETEAPVPEEPETEAQPAPQEEDPAEEVTDDPALEPVTQAAPTEVPTDAPTQESTEALTQQPSEEPTLSPEEKREREIMEELDAQLAELLAHPRRARAGSYEDELAKFPVSYQTALKELHKIHPNWIFVAVDTKLDWNAVITAENGERSTMEYNYGPNSIASHLLLNNRDGYYDPSSYSGTRHYKPLDGRFVSASRAAVAYYMDPRNFLNEEYIFQFESETYSEVAQVSGVTAILRSGCNTKAGLANKTTYITTSGATANLSDLSSQFGSTYSQIMYNIGVLLDVSPYFIASKIVQETSANTTTKVLCGNVPGFVGYYNFFNIGAYATADGTAWKNGLKYARNHGWSNPILAIKGGVEFLSEKYISKGQNTAYYMRFNVSPERSYDLYNHQYMSATAAAAGEGNSTFKGYQNAGAADSPFLFYIPVYRNMPDKTSVVSLTPTTKGKTTAQEILYNVPSATGTKLVTVPKGSTVTVLGGSVTSTVKYENRLYFPYWYQVKVTVSGKSYTGYLHEQSVSVDQVYHLKTGSTKSISAVTKVSSGYSGPIYYETSDPAVATVTATTGLIRAVGNGSCTIYAISGGGSFDAIGIKVSSSGTVSNDPEGSGPDTGKPDNNPTEAPTNAPTEAPTNDNSTAPVLRKAVNTTDGVLFTWKAYPKASSYSVYRKTGSSGWKLTGTTYSPKYQDYDTVSGTTYTYTVRARVNGNLTPYDKTGKSVLYLETPALGMANASSAGVDITWSAAGGAEGYKVFRKSGGSKWTLVCKITSASTTSWRDASSALKLGQEYTYTVRAYKGKSMSAFDPLGTSVIILEPIIDKLATPKLTSIYNGRNGIVVKWKSVTGADGYKIYRKTGNGKWKYVGKTRKTAFTDKRVTSNVTYTYTVRAYRGSKKSGYDKTGLTLLCLSTPVLRSATADANSILVEWNAVTGATGYKIYRKTQGGNWKVLATIGNLTAFRDRSSLTKGTRYSYTVKAVSGKTTSSYSADGVSAIAGVTLRAPVLDSVNNVSKGIRLNWRSVADARSYQVFRKSGGGDWTKIASTSALTYLDTTAAAGTVYQYSVCSVSRDQVSDYSAGKTILRLTTPQLISASSAADGITLKWGAVTGAQQYQVFRKVGSGDWALLQTVASTSLVDAKNIIKDTLYTYTVRAVNGDDQSSCSAAGISVKATTNGPEELVTYITTGQVNYRTNPGTSYPIVGTFKSGTKVQVVKGQSVQVGNTLWHRVKVDGNYYYASSKYMKPA